MEWFGKTYAKVKHVQIQFNANEWEGMHLEGKKKNILQVCIKRIQMTSLNMITFKTQCAQSMQNSN